MGAFPMTLNFLSRQQSIVLVLNRIQSHEEIDKQTEMPILGMVHPRGGKYNSWHRDINPNSAKPSVIFFLVFGAAQNSIFLFLFLCFLVITLYYILSNLILYPIFSLPNYILRARNNITVYQSIWYLGKSLKAWKKIKDGW